jgi:hypothetical protein
MKYISHVSIFTCLRPRVRAVGIMITLALFLFLTPGCVSQATFESADKAVDSLVAAVRAQDEVQLKNLLGSEGQEIISSGDPVADKNAQENFLKAYDEKHQLVAGDKGAMTLVVGKADWPLPIPLVQTFGKWHFDTDAGKDEILNRRVGKNELDAIQSCLAILDAQREYVSRDRDANGLREYATRFLSEPGKKNGLYWLTAANEPPSPLGPLAAEAAEEGYTGQNAAPHTPFHGYRFRILTSQGASAPGGTLDYMVNGKLIGGFAIVAWPAEYGNSGVMTFIMNHEGIVFQCDLGDDTEKSAKTMSSYNPGPDWKKVESAK